MTRPMISLGTVVLSVPLRPRGPTVLLLAILVIGLAAGWVADLVLHGRMRPESWGSLLLFGLAGSLVGGLLVSLLSGDGVELRLSGLVGSSIGAIITMLAVGFVQRRSST
jgi:uncharacterized membrane protein YeaQ/YmgE (transglycosylase-associated protein family)